MNNNPNNQKECKHKKNHRLVHDNILRLIKEEPRSVREIKEELENNNIQKSEKGIKEFYLDEMMVNKEIGSSNRLLGDNKDYNLIFRTAYSKKFDSTHMYYFHTPRSARLHLLLTNLTKDCQDKDRCLELIDSITDTFRFIELNGLFESERLSSDGLIKKCFKNRDGINLTQEQIEEKKKKYLNRMINSKYATGVNASFQEAKLNINALNDLNSFLNIMHTQMTDDMFFVAYYEEVNREGIGNPLKNMMIELFFEMKAKEYD